MNLVGSESEKNLLHCHISYCQSFTRMLFFSSKAKKEKRVQISAYFAEVAERKKALASRCYKLLQGGDVTFSGQFPAGGNRSTEENLLAAAKREEEERQQIFLPAIKTAKAEDIQKLIPILEGFINASKHHEQTFRTFADNLAQNRAFSREEERTWLCRKCGLIHQGKTPPDLCIACAHSKGYFELLAENW
ncbi:rubrerythrin family protein [Magnetococcales bacterium HHB-1]